MTNLWPADVSQSNFTAGIYQWYNHLVEKAKVFANGRSQAIRLPVEFRVDVKELYIRRDPDTGDLILSTRPNNWNHIEALLDELDPDTTDFMEDRDRTPPAEKDLF